MPADTPDEPTDLPLIALRWLGQVIRSEWDDPPGPDGSAGTAAAKPGDQAAPAERRPEPPPPA